MMGVEAEKFNFNRKVAQNDARINTQVKNSNRNKLNGYADHLSKYSYYRLNIKETE